MWLLQCSEVVESKLGKLETSRAVILFPKDSPLKEIKIAQSDK